MFSPIPRLEATEPNVVQKLRGADAVLTVLTLKSSASGETKQPHWRDKKERGKGGEELEVAAITYLRVSGLEGLGSPIISGVGSI